MSLITIFEPPSNIAWRVINLTPSMTLESNVPNGYPWVEGEHDLGTTYLSDEGEVLLLPISPGDWSRWNGNQWVDPRSQDEKADYLLEAKSQAKLSVQSIRAEFRLRFIPDILGQELQYMAKYEEAKAFVDLTARGSIPTPDDFPMIYSEVGITATTPEQVVQVFLNLNYIWRVSSGAVDRICFESQNQVDNSSSVEEIDIVIGELPGKITTQLGAL